MVGYALACPSDPCARHRTQLPIRYAGNSAGLPVRRNGVCANRILGAEREKSVGFDNRLADWAKAMADRVTRIAH